jgi:hypothetical protein
VSKPEPLDRTVVLAFDDLKATLRTDVLLGVGVLAMVAGTFGLLVGADAMGVPTLRWSAVAWCLGVLAVMRGMTRSRRFAKEVRYQLTLRDGELDVERRSPDAPASSTRLPRGTARLRRLYAHEGGVVRYCEVRLATGKLVLRARDQPVDDVLTGERRDLGDWLAGWFGGEAPA